MSMYKKPTKLLVRNKLLKELYDQAARYQSHRLDDIIKDNNMAYGDDNIWGELFHNGVVYKSSLRRRHDPTYYRTYPVHETLRERMNVWLTQQHQMIEEGRQSERVLTVIGNQNLGYEDYIRLLGTSLMDLAGSLAYALESELAGRKLTDQQFESLEKSTKPYLDAMRERVVDNMLSRDLYGDTKE